MQFSLANSRFGGENVKGVHLLVAVVIRCRPSLRGVRGMIDRRLVVTGLVAVAVAGLAYALPARATPRRSVAPVRATRSGLLYDNRYYHMLRRQT